MRAGEVAATVFGLAGALAGKGGTVRTGEVAATGFGCVANLSRGCRTAAIGAAAACADDGEISTGAAFDATALVGAACFSGPGRSISNPVTRLPRPTPRISSPAAAISISFGSLNFSIVICESAGGWCNSFLLLLLRRIQFMENKNAQSTSYRAK